MSIDYLVASLPVLKFGEPASMTMEAFVATIAPLTIDGLLAEWRDIERELKNALAIARATSQGDANAATKYLQPSTRCSLYWRNRALAAYGEREPLRRDEAIDRVFWDAADQLVPASDPLGKGALAAYAVRLEIAIKRGKISADRGNAAFDRLTAETRITF